MTNKITFCQVKKKKRYNFSLFFLFSKNSPKKRDYKNKMKKNTPDKNKETIQQPSAVKLSANTVPQSPSSSR